MIIISTLSVFLLCILSLINQKFKKHLRILLGLMFWFVAMYVLYGFIWTFDFDAWPILFKIEWISNSIMIGISFNLVKYHNI